MSDLMQLTMTERDHQALDRGALPEAPMAMPAQVLERADGGFFASLFRLRLVQAPKTGH
jgi:hypothetical protein